MLQSECKKNQDQVYNTGDSTTAAQTCMFPGGRHRSVDHPNQVNEGYKTMSAFQLERRAARWGHISLEQLEASIKARELPGSPPPPGQAGTSPSQYKDLFRSYKQGLNQSVAHYLDVKRALFKQGWPDPAEKSNAFFILRQCARGMQQHRLMQPGQRGYTGL